MKPLLFVFLILTCYNAAATTDGIAFTSENSDYDFATTLTRVKSEIASAGFTVFTVIDHADQAAQAGAKLWPTQVIVFGDPKIGTALIQNCAQSVGLDLPMKILIWEDEEGEVWVSYNKWTLLDMRHEFNHCSDLLEQIEDTLADISDAAAG